MLRGWAITKKGDTASEKMAVKEEIFIWEFRISLSALANTNISNHKINTPKIFDIIEWMFMQIGNYRAWRMNDNKIHSSIGLLQHVIRWNQVSNLCHAMTYKKITVKIFSTERTTTYCLCGKYTLKFHDGRIFFIDSQFASLIFINLKFTEL